MGGFKKRMSKRWRGVEEQTKEVDEEEEETEEEMEEGRTRMGQR